ncbi:MAG: polyprenyl synthetase family protein [Longimicrobiales bacterium]
MLRTAIPRLSEIQRPVTDQLDQVIEELRRIVATDFSRIDEVNDYLLGLRGKLFRPTLLLLCNAVEGRPSPRAVTLAAAVELVHLATLVHDDAVDHSVLRRGMPTVNALWNHQTAIIMGDYLYSRAVTELTTLGELELIAVLARAANEMSIGEMRQLASHDTLAFDEADYWRLIAAKTASLMSAACELGAVAGGRRFQQPLARYGHHLGMAFQIADDLLDYTGTEGATGKPTGQDLREHKVTLPLIAALARMSAVERAYVGRFFADPEPSADAIVQTVGLVQQHGGLEVARRRAHEYGERAAEALLELPPSPATESLRAAISYVIERRR